MDALVIGLDLNDDYTQLACAGTDKLWTFPTVVCRKKNAEVWMAGEEAYASTLLGEGVIVDKLLKLASKNGTATIGGICYPGNVLLKTFIEKMLEYPMKEFGRLPVETLVVTVQEVDARLMDGLMYCADGLGIDRNRIHVISHTESFIYYILSQKKELWSNQVGLFELSSERLCYYEMKVQRGLRKNMVQARAQRQEEAFSLDVLNSASGAHLADQILCACGEKLLSKKLFSTILLTGRGFENLKWAQGFMKLICNRRRVFSEGALFAKGALFKGKDSLAKESAYPYIFVCEGRLTSEVSMKVMVRGKEHHLVVASFGDSWYEAKISLELILDGEEELELTITPMDMKNIRVVRIPLVGFPARPPRTTRVEMNVGFTDEHTMKMVIKDKGFGELFAASDTVIKQEVVV